MSEQAALPHSSGELSESQAVERMLAKAQAGKIPEPRTPDEMLDDRDDAPPVETAEEEPPAEDEPVVEGDEFAEEEAEEAPATNADPVVKFDDGTEMPLSEVKRGFLRQQDYTRKTQEVATQRKQVETERATYLAEKKAVAERLTPLIQQAMAQLEGSTDAQALAELRATDPGAYAVRMMEIQNRRAQLEQLAFQQGQLREQAEREEMQRAHAERQQMAEQSRAVLIEKIPAAKKDFAGWYKAVGEYALANGISPEEWDSEARHSAILMVYKAMQYDAAGRKAPATKEQLRKAPQPMRPGAAKPPGYAQARVVREATERAHKSGTIEDAIAAQKVKLASSRR